MRISAACTLLEEDILEDKFTVTTKGSKRVRYPITPDIRRIIDEARRSALCKAIDSRVKLLESVIAEREKAHKPSLLGKLTEKQQKAEEYRRDFERKKQQDAATFRGILIDLPLPETLAAPIPVVQGTEASLPEPKLFEELAGLYAYGAGLQLEWVPLAQPRSLQIVTRKLDPRKLPLPDETPEAVSDTEPETVATEADMPDLFSAQAERAEALQAEIEADNTWIPDTVHFEWTVVGIDPNTSLETPLFDLLLTQEGLQMAWRRESFNRALYHNALQSTLGFLRVASLGEHPASVHTREIPLFTPTVLEALSPAEAFGAETTQVDWAVKMPFADEPWRDLFANTVYPFVFRIEAQVSPQEPTGILSIAPEESESLSQVRIQFETDATSRRPLADGRIEAVNITVSLSGMVNPLEVTWTDLFAMQQKELEDSLTADGEEQKRLEAQLVMITQDMLNAVAETRETMRPQRDQINATIEALRRRQPELQSHLNRLPEAHRKLVGNKELAVDFAIFLDPISPSDTVSKKRSLLLMKTRGFDETGARVSASESGERNP